MSNIIDVEIDFTQQYDICVGQHLYDELSAFCETRYSPKRAFVIIDENVQSLHAERVKTYVDYFEDVYFLTVPEGEESKSVTLWHRFINEMLNKGIERSTPIIAVGGGVTGDLGGFVAATALRGVPLIHMPTSLLAMVDSSIGGKTGVNHSTGKNLIGSFYQPDAVFTDVAFLDTLDQREWITGLAEILKYAAIRNPKLFDELDSLVHQPLTPRERWSDIIEESARIKSDIVEQDTLEAGTRAYLNFGHTFGHALEKVLGYGTVTHGEAVFVGMIAAAHFSEQMGHSVNDARFTPFLSLYKKQMNSFSVEADELIDAMKSDKKVKNNIIRLVLLNEWGSPYLYSCKDSSLLADSWNYTMDKFNR